MMKLKILNWGEKWRKFLKEFRGEINEDVRLLVETRKLIKVSLINKMRPSSLSEFVNSEEKF